MTATTDAVTTLRTHWTNRFTDAVDVTRMTGRGTFNATTGLYASSTDSTIFTGAALIRPGDNIDRTQYGDRLVTGLPMLVYLEHDAAVFDLEDAVEVTACAFDSALVGKVLTVAGLDFDSYQTRIRLVCRVELGGGYGG